VQSPITRILTDDVVSEGILNQGQSVESDLGNELDSLRVSGMVDTSLEDTTSVSVGGNLDTMSGNSVVDELGGGKKQPSGPKPFVVAYRAHSLGCPRGSIGSNTSG